MTTQFTMLLSEWYDHHIGDRPGYPASSRDSPQDDDVAGSIQILERILTEARAQSALIDERQQQKVRHPGKHHFDGGVDVNTIKDIGILLTASGASLLAFFKTVQPLLREWLKNRASREVSISFRDVQISVKGSTDMTEAFRAIERLIQSPLPAKDAKALTSGTHGPKAVGHPASSKMRDKKRRRGRKPPPTK